MNTVLKPWTRAAFELIVHAELHFRDGGDFDRRIAHIGFDNAIEVAITTYLALNPIQRSKKSYPRADVERWLTNFHTKLEFLESEAKARNWNLKVPNDETVFYHDIRNAQYHTGGPGVPEADHLTGLRGAALDTFAMLFDCPQVEAILEQHVQSRKVVAEPEPRADKTADEIIDLTFGPVLIVDEAYDTSTVLFSTDPDAYAEIVSEIRESRNCLDDLCKLYPRSLRTEITGVTFVHFKDKVFLKLCLMNGETELTDTDFISGKNEDGRFFSPNRTPNDNVDCLLHEFDPYSIINCFNFISPSVAVEIGGAYESGTLKSFFESRTAR